MRSILEALLRSTFTLSMIVAALTGTRSSEASTPTWNIGSCAGYPNCSGTCAPGGSYTAGNCKEAAGGGTFCACRP